MTQRTPNAPEHETATRPVHDPSHDAARLLEFIKWNQPLAASGLLVILFGLWLTGSPALYLLLSSVLANIAAIYSASRDLRRTALDPAVVKLALGLWGVGLALWFTLPRLYGVSLIIFVLPIVLAASYVRRQRAMQFAVAGVACSAVGGALHPWRPLLGEVGLPNVMVELLIVGFTPLVVASCGLAMWHAVSRLLELLEDSQETNRALAASEHQLETKVDARTADLRNSQRELAFARDEALAANRAKSTFLANMSHELRTPLNAIIGYSEMLQEDTQDAGHSEYTQDLDRIVSSGKHLLGLINDVLDLTKIEAGKVELHAEPLDVGELIDAAAQTIRPLIAENGNQLEVIKSPALGSIESDVTRVRQILFNLLSNAAKFTSDGTVTLSGERTTIGDSDWIVFRVSDTGIGMTADQMQNIFDAFNQAETTTTRDFGGTGLGLAITQRFCEMLGGTVAVASKPGVGSEFTIRLPIAMPSDLDAGETESEVEGPDFAGASILVIDDEPTARELLQRTLEREGYRVACASNAEQGLAKARKQRPDLITLDILMPHVDGWSVLRELKDDPALKDIPVVVVTMTDDKELSTALGAAEFVSKPIDRQRLGEIVRRFAGTTVDASVMIVEDDADTRTLLMRTVAREGFQVVEAENGLDALAKLEEHAPAAILMDLIMPEMDGFELLARLREDERFREIPVVVVTAKELTQSEHQELVSSAERVLQKGSYDRGMLISEIRRHLAFALDGTTPD